MISNSSFRYLIQISVVLPAVAIQLAVYEDMHLVACKQEWCENVLSYATVRTIQGTRLSVHEYCNIGTLKRYLTGI